MWKIEYEQDRVTTRTYKNDHEFIADGLWHELRAGSRAQYRIARDTLQFVSPENDEAKAELPAILELVASVTPLTAFGVVEVEITKEPDGYRVLSYADFEHHPNGVIVPTFSTDELVAAIWRLRLGDDWRRLKDVP